MLRQHFFFAIKQLNLAAAQNSSQDVILKQALTSIIEKFLVEYKQDFGKMDKILDKKSINRFETLIMEGIPLDEKISFNDIHIDEYLIPFVYTNDKKWKFTPSLFTVISRKYIESKIDNPEKMIIDSITTFAQLKLDIDQYCSVDVINTLCTYFDIKPLGKFSSGLLFLQHLELMGKYNDTNTSVLRAACQELQYVSIINLIDNYNPKKD